MVGERERGLGRIDRINGSFNLQKEQERFGDVLWKGEPLEVTEDVLIPPGRAKSVGLLLTPSSLPFGGDISPEALELMLKFHMRSSWAHVFADLARETVENVTSALQDHPLTEEGIPMRTHVINHGSRPLLMRAGIRPFHFFTIPEKARVLGEELDKVMGSEEGKGVRIMGEEGKDWFKDYEVTPDGRKRLRGAYVAVEKGHRYWIPDSNEPIDLPPFASFRQTRDYLFENHFKRSDDPQFAMPRNHIWVGRITKLEIADGYYAVLDHDAFALLGGEFARKGLQTHSPLLDDRALYHHVEVKGPAEWVRVKFVRSSESPKAG